jgi:group I intron endonuclease
VVDLNISGIYKIKSICKPDRIYIGSASNIYNRWHVHLTELKRGTHHSKKLQRHYNKYGESDLQFMIIEKCKLNELLIKEQYLLDNFKPYFNCCFIAGSIRGFKHSIERKDYISKFMSGNNYGCKNKGKKKGPFTEEHKFNMRGKRGPNNMTHEEREKRRQRMKNNRYWEISPGNKGTHYNLSQTTKDKMRERMKGNKINNGRLHSGEHKKKISETLKLTWNNRKLKIV